MSSITVTIASPADKNDIQEYFRHYGVKSEINNRVDCYLKHHHTTIAKEKDKIIGVIQWHVKENPQAGVVEFEEMHIIETHRRQGIAADMLEFTIKSVKDYFQTINIPLRRIYLFVSEENQTARKLYEKFGFEKVTPVGNLFSDSTTELFYILKLT